MSELTARLDLWLRRFVCRWFGHDIYVPTAPFQFRPLWCRRCAKSYNADTNEWKLIERTLS